MGCQGYSGEQDHIVTEGSCLGGICVLAVLPKSSQKTWVEDILQEAGHIGMGWACPCEKNKPQESFK